MPDPKLGAAALAVTISREQVEAAAKAAIVPAMEAAAKEGGARLSAATASGGSSGIQKMIAQQQQLAEATRKAAAAQRAEYDAFNRSVTTTGDAAGKTGTKIRGLGAAAGEVGQAFGGAAGDATRLGSVLAYGGIAGGAAIGISKLVELGQSMNDVGLSAEKLTELAGKTREEMAGMFQVGTAFGGSQDAIKKLTDQGAAGVGTLLNLRDAALAAGRDTSQFDAALEQLSTTQSNLRNTTERGAEWLDIYREGERRAAEEADRLAAAARRLEAATNASATASAQMLTSQGSIVAANNRLAQARDRLSKFGTEATGKSISEQRSEARAVEDAAQRIVDAQQKIIDARQKVEDAKEKLAHAGEHELLDVQDAQDDVDAALRKLNASTPEERGPAQHALDDAEQKLEDAKRALESAKPDAERAYNDAVRNLTDAQRDEQRAVESLGDAQAKQAEQSKGATRSQQDYQAAVDDVNEALLAQAQAVAHQKDLEDQLATGTANGPVKQLQNLKQALQDVADELDPNSELAQRIIYLLASMTPYAIEQTFGQAGSGGEVARRAGGGDVWDGMKFRGAEEGPELLVRDGMYKAPPGRSTVFNARDTAALLGAGGQSGPREVHHHTHYWTVIARNEPTEVAIRRELDRRDMFASR